jgi:hypothetical protein
MEIHAASFIFHIKALEPILLPPYKGSTLRGGFGNAFRRTVCVMRDKECTDCLLKGKCVYSYVFETPPPADTKLMRKYEAAPHPFVIQPPIERKQVYKPGEDLTFGLVLIGRAIDYLPYFIYTFDELGKTGLGRGRGKFVLKTVESEESGVRSEPIYDDASKTLKQFNAVAIPLDGAIKRTRKKASLTLRFLTPARITYDGRLTLDIGFHMFIRTLLRRLSLLVYFHCGIDPSTLDFTGIIEQAKKIEVSDTKLSWYDWERYSGRQERKIAMGGFIGDITFKGALAPFMPLIKAGEVLHVGKGTAFGLGRYSVEESEVRSQES